MNQAIRKIDYVESLVVKDDLSDLDGLNPYRIGSDHSVSETGGQILSLDWQTQFSGNVGRNEVDCPAIENKGERSVAIEPDVNDDAVRKQLKWHHGCGLTENLEVRWG